MDMQTTIFYMICGAVGLQIVTVFILLMNGRKVKVDYNKQNNEQQYIQEMPQPQKEFWPKVNNQYQPPMPQYYNQVPPNMHFNPTQHQPIMPQKGTQNHKRQQANVENEFQNNDQTPKNYIQQQYQPQPVQPFIEQPQPIQPRQFTPQIKQFQPQPQPIQPQREFTPDEQTRKQMIYEKRLGLVKMMRERKLAKQLEREQQSQQQPPDLLQQQPQQQQQNISQQQPPRLI